MCWNRSYHGDNKSTQWSRSGPFFDVVVMPSVFTAIVHGIGLLAATPLSVKNVDDVSIGVVLIGSRLLTTAI